MDNLLRVFNLSSGYKDNLVIKNISFEVKSKQFIGLIGPNGAGKTTLFKTLFGILTPRQGKIYLRDKDLFQMSFPERAKEIAILPQFFLTSFSYTIEEFILLGRFPHRDRFLSLTKYDRILTQKVIDMLLLSGIRKRKINEISGGEFQKVLIAQAIVQEPKLLLLDEPTSHLDIGHQIEIMDLLKRLNQDGLTIVAVLHDLNLASEYCSRLILLNDGKIIKDGSPWEVMDYKLIEEVYKTTVVIKENPYSKKPFLILYSKK